MAYSDNFDADLISLVTNLESAELLEMSNMLYTKSFQDEDITESHEVVTGIRNGSVMPILKDNPEVESFPFVDAETCTSPEATVTHDFSSHTWEVGLIKSKVGICMNTFSESFNKFFNVYKRAHGEEADVDSAIIEFITGKFTQNLRLATWRASYFGDKSSASPFFNGIDGIFAQAEANASQVVDITENDGVDFASQALTGEQALDYLDEMYYKASEQAWFDDSIMQYTVNRTMAAKIVTHLNKLGDKAPMHCTCIDPATKIASRVFAINGLTINGLPVLVRAEFDKIINGSSELNGGGGAAARVNPNRAILTYRENLLIGTTEVDQLNKFSVWYSQDDEKVYLKGSSYIGAGIPLKDEYILAI